MIITGEGFDFGVHDMSCDSKGRNNSKNSMHAIFENESCGSNSVHVKRGVNESCGSNSVHVKRGVNVCHVSIDSVNSFERKSFILSVTAISLQEQSGENIYETHGEKDSLDWENNCIDDVYNVRPHLSEIEYRANREVGSVSHSESSFLHP